ncbi:hypothetical protein KA037_01475 [Patescibacteria group bacterium]|nr:hypothetical protein [Patescibacteria group bacterium]MBP7841333.1 hypothetical protein [Patescibacteria group bacterium]
MKLKIDDLRTQEKKLISLRDQIQKMEKNIDKSKIITPDERKIMQALDAINFLIQNIKPG